MALDLGTLVAKLKVDDGDFDKKTDSWSQKGAGIASAFGNVAADAISKAADMLSDFVGEAMAASDATDKFKGTLAFAGLDDSKIKSLTKSTQAYADETVYSLTDIQGITATLAANGVEGYESLAESLGNLNAVAGGNAETFGRVGSVLTQTAGQGKLTTENWNQLTDAIPGASKKLQDALLAAGAYTGNFREAMEKGEITAEEFNAAIQEVGTDPIAVEAARSVTTFEGATGNLSAAIQKRLVAALDAVKPAITGFTGGITWIVENLEPLLPVFAGLGAVILGALAPAIWGAVTATWAFTTALLANPITWIVLAIGALVAALVLLFQNWDTVVAWISDVWSGFVSWLTDVTNAVAQWWNDLWAGVGEWIQSVWQGFINFVTSIFNAWLLGVRMAGAALASWWNGLWRSVGDFFRNTWSGFINFVTSIWNAWLLGVRTAGMALASWWNGLWSGVGNTIQSTWSGFISFVRGIWSGFVSFIQNGLNAFVGWWTGLWNTAMTGARTIWDGFMGFVRGIPGAIQGAFNGAVTWLYNIGRDIINGLWNGLKSIWGSVERWFNDTFGGIIDMVAGIFDIHSPSRVMHHLFRMVGLGAVEGLKSTEGDLDDEFARMVDYPYPSVPDTAADAAAARSRAGAGGGSGNTLVYVAAENQSLSTEEALYAALGGPRSPFGGE